MHVTYASIKLLFAKQFYHTDSMNIRLNQNINTLWKTKINIEKDEKTWSHSIHINKSKWKQIPKEYWRTKKLDGVGPIDNKPFTDQLHHFFQFFFDFCFMKKIFFHVTCDTWHVTHETWHIVWDDTWHMTHSVGWTFS